MSEKDTAPTLTHSQCVNRQREITAELERLDELDVLSPEDETYFRSLTEEFTTVDNHRKRLERQAELAKVRSAAERANGSNIRLERGNGPASPGFDESAILEPDSVSDRRFRNPWDLSEVRTFGVAPQAIQAELRSRALSAVERMPFANDTVREAATNLIERSDDEDSRLAKLALATSSPEYMQAFVAQVRSFGKADLDGDVRAAYTRAMSLTDAAGGFLVPFQIDPTVILTANGSRNQIRQAARVVQTTGDVWRGISSAGVTGSWDAEAAEVSDDSPTFGQPEIPVYKGSVFVAASLEVAQDAQGLAGELASMIADEKDRMESEAFVTGSGTGQPTGIVTALDGTASEVAVSTAETFALADVYALDSALPARWRSNASWLAHRSIYNRIRQFDTNGGAGLWERLGNGQPPALLGRPALEAESMDSSWNAAASGDNFIAVYGDFRNYVIADRVGTTIEYIPHLFGANRRPTGQRGWYAYFRVGADSVNDNAFRMLNLATTV